MWRTSWLLLILVALAACGETMGNLRATQTRSSEIGVFATQTRVVELTQLATITARVAATDPTVAQPTPTTMPSPTPTIVSPTPANLSTCPKDKPIKGYTSPTGEKLYEIPESVRYNQVPAEACFYNTSGAAVAGYHQPNEPFRPLPTETPTAPIPAHPITPQVPNSPTVFIPPSLPTAGLPAPSPTTVNSVGVGGCDGGVVTIRFNPQLEKDLNQWNRITGASNKVTTAWNTFVDTTDGITTFEDAAGNTDLVRSIDAVLAIAQAQLPALQAETPEGRFATLAEKETIHITAMIKYLSLLREASLTENVDVWNSAIDAQDEFHTTGTALDFEVQAQCDFWHSQH